MQPVIFIARLVGPLFIVLGLGCLINQTVYADMIGQAVLVPVVIYLSGLMSFLAGVAMLNGYHSWTPDWRIIVTILGWLLVIAGRFLFQSSEPDCCPSADQLRPCLFQRS